MPYKVIVKVGGVNSKGARYSVCHIMKPEIKLPGGNEWGVSERVASTYSNLPLPVDRQNPRSVSAQLVAAARYSRSKTPVRSVILSFEDTTDEIRRNEQVALSIPLLEQFVKIFAPGAAYWSATHVDRNHVHMHLLLSNWSPVMGQSLNWSRRDLVYMLSMRWCQQHPSLGPVVDSGAWTKAERTDMAYPRAEACLKLVAILKDSPALELLNLERDKQITRYQTKGGHAGIVFMDKKITLKNLNYALLKAGASEGIGPDYKAKSIRPVVIDDIAQQTKIDVALGFHGLSPADYSKLCDLPDPNLLRLDDAGLHALKVFKTTGRILDPNHACILRRLTRTALLRRMKGASKPVGADDFSIWVFGDCRKWTPAMNILVAGVVDQMGELGCALMKMIEVLLSIVTGAPPVELS
jgi:hypothetical protein